MLCENCKEIQLVYLLTINRGSFRKDLEYQHYRCPKCHFEKAFGDSDAETLNLFYSKSFHSSSQQKALTPSSPIVINSNKRLKRLAQYIESKNTLMDIGAGNGIFVKEASNICNAFGIDNSPFAFENAKRLGIEILQADLFSHDFSSTKINVITLWDVVSCFDDHVKLLNKTNDLLENNGFLIFTVPNSDSFVAKLFGRLWPLRIPPISFTYHSKKSIQKLIEQYKELKIIEMYTETKLVNLQFIFYKLCIQLGMPKFAQVKIPFFQKLNIPLNLGDILTVVIKKEKNVS